MADSKTAFVSQYSLTGPSIEARIVLTDDRFAFSGKTNSGKIVAFLKSIHENFSGWIDFSITVGNDGVSTLSLNQGLHGLTLEGRVDNFDIESLRNGLQNKKVGIVAATASTLHKLAGQSSGSDNLDMLSDIFAEEVKMVGQAPEIKPRVHLHTRLLRLFYAN
jgi:hypothetical protein